MCSVKMYKRLRLEQEVGLTNHLWVFGVHTYQGYVQFQNSVQCFAAVSGLINMLPRNGVKQCATGFDVCFLSLVGVSHLMAVSHIIPNQQRCLCKLVVIKRQSTCT